VARGPAWAGGGGGGGGGGAGAILSPGAASSYGALPTVTRD